MSAYQHPLTSIATCVQEITQRAKNEKNQLAPMTKTPTANNQNTLVCGDAKDTFYLKSGHRAISNNYGSHTRYNSNMPE